uniref:Uncharacterized protein n=1 Tax=Anopheles quadriannulatus TaxID=34691 RepID=A0A182XU51_ANOQN
FKFPSIYAPRYINVATFLIFVLFIFSVIVHR